MSTDVQITLGVIAFFVILALLTFMRLLLRKQPPSWRSIRLGVFVERIAADREESPPGYRRKEERDDLRDE